VLSALRFQTNCQPVINTLLTNTLSAVQSALCSQTHYQLCSLQHFAPQQNVNCVISTLLTDTLSTVFSSALCSQTHSKVCYQHFASKQTVNCVINTLLINTLSAVLSGLLSPTNSQLCNQYFTYKHTVSCVISTSPQNKILLHVGIRKRRFHGNVITVNRCVDIAWDNKRVSPETVITKGPLSNNGSDETRYHYL
jgi:hypothetical protein